MRGLTDLEKYVPQHYESLCQIDTKGRGKYIYGVLIPGQGPIQLSLQR